MDRPPQVGDTITLDVGDRLHQIQAPCLIISLFYGRGLFGATLAHARIREPNGTERQVSWDSRKPPPFRTPGSERGEQGRLTL